MSKKFTRFMTHAGALLIALVALQGSAAAQVTVFADVNYSGNSQTFNGNVPNLVDVGFNDTISSIRIPNGERWQFCDDVNFQGNCQTLQGSIADLRNINWNDKISSMRRVGGGVFGRNRGVYGSTGTTGYREGSGATLFANPNFRGRSMAVNGDVADLRELGMNDQVTSIEIPSGETWEICQDVNFGGECQMVRGSVSDLRDIGWNDRISSMRRVGNSRGYRDRRYNDGVGTSGNYRQDGLVFFDRPNFRGTSTLVTNNASTQYVPRTGSVQVRGGGVWRVCDNEGECATIDRDVEDLRDLGLYGRITSVREVSQSRRWFPLGR